MAEEIIVNQQYDRELQDLILKFVMKLQKKNIQYWIKQDGQHTILTIWK